MAGIQSLGTMIVQLQAQTAQYERAMARAERTTVDRMKGVETAVTRGAAAVAAAIAVLSAAAIREFAKFDDAMTKSTAIMGNVSKEMRKQMELTAREIATRSVTSSTKLAEAYYFLASAGLNAEQSIASLNTVNQFAIAGAFDMAQATDLLTDAQSALGLTVKDSVQNMQNMQRVSDVLVKANTLANASVEQFSVALTSKAGASLKAFNKDVEEGVAVLAAMADQGIKAELAGNALDRIVRLLSQSAMENAAAHRALNFQVFDQTGKMRNLGTIMQELEGILAGMSDETKVATLDMLGFEARVQQVILPLLGTGDAIVAYEEKLRSAGGTTDDVANKQMASFSAQMKIVWNQFKEGLLILGEKLIPTIHALIRTIGEATGGSNNWYKSMKILGSFLSTTLYGIIVVVGEAINWWRKVILRVKGALEVVINFLHIALLDTKRVFLELTQQMLDFMEFSLRPVLDMINLIIGGYNKILGKNLEKIGFNDLVDRKGIDAQIEELRKKLASLRSINAGEDSFNAANDVPGFGDFTRRFSNQVTHGQSELENPQVTQQREVENEIVKIVEEAEKKKAEVREAYQIKAVNGLKAFLSKEQLALVANAESIAGDLTSIARDLAGEQSGIYKTLFAVSKAFAIADSIVKIQQAIANASAMPFPANIAAIAQVVSLTAGIVSTIKATQMTGAPSFLGGGYTGTGSRTGGLDGRGGFMAMVHPDEKVVDLKKEGAGMVVNIYNNAGVEVNAKQNGSTLDIYIDMEKRLAQNLRQGTGPFTRQMQSTYNLKRNPV